MNRETEFNKPTETQLKRSAANRERAKELLKVRVVQRNAAKQPIGNESAPNSGEGNGPISAKKTRVETVTSLRDSGGGFFIEDEELLADDGDCTYLSFI